MSRPIGKQLYRREPVLLHGHEHALTVFKLQAAAQSPDNRDMKCRAVE